MTLKDFDSLKIKPGEIRTINEKELIVLTRRKMIKEIQNDAGIFYCMECGIKFEEKPYRILGQRPQRESRQYPLCSDCHTKYLDIDLSKDYNEEVKP